MTINHVVMPGVDLQLAMIEGHEVEAFCGVQFVPTVQVGTSGSAAAPGAPRCSRCDDLHDIALNWVRVKDERNRLNRELYALNREYKKLRRVAREEREVTRLLEPTLEVIVG